MLDPVEEGRKAADRDFHWCLLVALTIAFFTVAVRLAFP